MGKELQMLIPPPVDEFGVFEIEDMKGRRVNASICPRYLSSAKVVDITTLRASDPDRRALIEYAWDGERWVVVVYNCFPRMIHGQSLSFFLDEPFPRTLEVIGKSLELPSAKLLEIVLRYAPERT
jgi:hypothetical protein